MKHQSISELSALHLERDLHGAFGLLQRSDGRAKVSKSKTHQAMIDCR